MASSPRVLEQAQISPPPGTAAAAAPLPLTYLDINWLYAGKIEHVFLYPFLHSTAHFLAHHLPALKSSLSHSLRRFYPFSGRVHPGTDHAPLEIRYQEGDSISFTVTESDDAFHQLCLHHPRAAARLAALLPPLPPSDASGAVPLLAVQATVFPGSGLCVGLAAHHVAGDDLSFMHFVHSWAAANKSGAAALDEITPPCYDRALVADPEGLYDIYFNAMQPPDRSEPQPEPDVAFASVALGRDDIERLKRKVQVRARELGRAPFHCSAFVVTLAHAWACLFKAQGRGGAGKQAHLVFPADFRGRRRPPLPAEYFGNCLSPCLVETSMDELLGGEGLAAAAEAIGRAIGGLEAERGLSSPEDELQKFISVMMERPMWVTGTPKARVFDVDFGWGKPVKVEAPAIRHSSATVSLAENREETGGTEIGLALPAGEMERFLSCFTQGLNLL